MWGFLALDKTTRSHGTFDIGCRAAVLVNSVTPSSHSNATFMFLAFLTAKPRGDRSPLHGGRPVRAAQRKPIRFENERDVISICTSVSADNWRAQYIYTTLLSIQLILTLPYYTQSIYFLNNNYVYKIMVLFLESYTYIEYNNNILMTF